jgi:hypothetical protein
MLVGWKLSQIARGEGRLYDAILADEFYDAAYTNTKQFAREKIGRLRRRHQSRREELVSKVPFTHWS